MTASVWMNIIAPLGIGLLMAQGHPPVGQPILTIAGLILMMLMARSIKGIWPLVRFGWLLGIGYFAAITFWIIEPFFVEPDRHGWMAPFALIGLSAGLGLFWAAAFGLAAWFGRGRSTAVGLAICLSIVEVLRAYVFTGFPWGMIAYVWLDTPVIHSVALLGPHFLTLVTLLLVALPFSRTNWRRVALVSVSTIAVMAVAGYVYQNQHDDLGGSGKILRLVQPNVPQNQKWDPRFADGFFQRQLDLTAKDGDLQPDLVIWPEAAVAFWMESEPVEQAKIATVAGEAAVIIGARRFDGRRIYNSLALLDGTGAPEKIYDKHRLVPFGEYIPFGSLFSRLGIYGLATDEGGGFAAGPAGRLLDLGDLGMVLPLICYEAIFPHFLHRSARADWILQITNDAWFGDRSGPQQHFAQARVRAIEQGLIFVRVANTGVTAMISPTGTVMARLPMATEGVLDVELPKGGIKTLYSRLGDTPIFIFLLGAILILFYRRREKSD